MSLSYSFHFPSPFIPLILLPSNFCQSYSCHSRTVVIFLLLSLFFSFHFPNHVSLLFLSLFYSCYSPTPVTSYSWHFLLLLVSYSCFLLLTSLSYSCHSSSPVIGHILLTVLLCTFLPHCIMMFFFLSYSYSRYGGSSALPLPSFRSPSPPPPLQQSLMIASVPPHHSSLIGKLQPPH
jgi:hypothetical protein